MSGCSASSGRRKCSISQDCIECFSSQLFKLKIAVALVVIRNKPADQNIKEFVQNLTQFHRDKEQRWKAEYFRLKQEVLQLRQQQLLLGFSSQIDKDSQSTQKVERLRSFSQHSLELLTPPDSQQSLNTSVVLPIDEKQPRENNSEEDASRMTFLRAYFYLEHHLRLNRPIGGASNDVLKNDVICQSVFSVLKHVDCSVSKEQSDFPKCLESLQMCVGMLDRHNKWSTSMREKFGELFSCWLQRVKENGNVFRYYALLEIIVDSDAMAFRTADILCKSIVEAQKLISEWDGNRMELIPQSVLAHFSNASYSVLLLEKTIGRMAATDKARIVPVLSHIEPSVHLNFPLFAASIMRLAHQITN